MASSTTVTITLQVPRDQHELLALLAALAEIPVPKMLLRCLAGYLATPVSDVYLDTRACRELDKLIASGLEPRQSLGELLEDVLDVRLAEKALKSGKLIPLEELAAELGWDDWPAGQDPK